jgi:hypothetical protein
MESIHEGIRYGCPYCPAQMTQKTYLRTHIVLKHPGMEVDMGAIQPEKSST